jgi:hypothetical protein
LGCVSSARKRADGRGSFPNALRPAFERLVTEVPSRLAAGERDEKALRASVLPLVDSILDYCADHVDAPAGIEIAAQQMLTRLVIRVGADDDRPPNA